MSDDIFWDPAAVARGDADELLRDLARAAAEQPPPPLFVDPNTHVEPMPDPEPEDGPAYVKIHWRRVPPDPKKDFG